MQHPRLKTDQIALKSGLPKSTVYRFLKSLLEAQYLEKNGFDQTYRLGSGILRLGRIAEAGLGFRDFSIPWMDKLFEMTGETVVLAIRMGTSWLCLEKREKDEMGIRFSVHPGQTGPIYAGAVGKVPLAFLNDVELSIVLGKLRFTKITERTTTDRKALLVQLAEIKTLGYCYSEAEYTSGVWALAAPLLNSTGIAEAALGIHGILANKPNPSIMSEHIRLLLEASQSISKRLGYLSGRAQGSHNLAKKVTWV